MPVCRYFFGVLNSEHITIKQFGCLGIVLTGPDKIDQKIKVLRPKKVIEHTS